MGTPSEFVKWAAMQAFKGHSVPGLLKYLGERTEEELLGSIGSQLLELSSLYVADHHDPVSVSDESRLAMEILAEIKKICKFPAQAALASTGK